MLRKILFAAIGLTLFAAEASAQTCGSLPNNLTNGTTADAGQVMANFNALLSCALGASNLSLNGYQKFGNGLMIEWTYANVPISGPNSGTTASFSWPTPFPHGILSVQTNQWSAGAWTFSSTQNDTASGGTVSVWNLAGAAGTSIGYSIVGIGY